MPAPILSKYIHPDTLSRVAHLPLRPRQLVEGNLAGAHKSPFHGFAVEFASHREYVPGDDIRHLDWKVYYRRDKLFIKQYEMETNLVCHLVLDVSASMRYGQDQQQKLHYAARAAATLGYLVVEHSDKVALALVDDRVREALAPANNLGQVLRMTEALDRVEPTQKTDLGPALLDVAARAGRRAIIVVFSDFLVDDLAALEQSLQRLRYDRHEVVLMQVMHHHELTFEFPGMVKFVGLEEEAQYLTRPDDIKAAYLDNLRAFNEQLERIADANRCERVLCDTSRPLGEFFADYLQQRSLRRRRW